jgi:hypothetical protein
MKLYTLVAALLFSHMVFATNRVVEEVSIDSSLIASPPKANQIYYGWKLFSWNDWLRRPSSGPLMIPGDRSKKMLEVFEAHSAGVVDKPVSTFTQQYLHNINTIRRLDPKNQHQQLNGSSFTITTRVEFPQTWARLILAAKTASLLADDSAPYLEMKSVFVYANQVAINASPNLQRIIKLFDENAPIPAVINIQGIVEANQIAEFGSVITLFYPLDNQRTLVVNYFALALKKRILDLGLGNIDPSLSGRNVLLGQNRALNGDSGIGAGLPVYTREFFEKMLQGL